MDEKPAAGALRPPAEPEPARFECWDAEGTAALCVAPQCATHKAIAALRDADCWAGHLTRQGERIELRRGHFARGGAPVGRIAWVGTDGPLLVADIPVDGRVDLWGADRSRCT